MNEKKDIKTAEKMTRNYSLPEQALSPSVRCARQVPPLRMTESLFADPIEFVFDSIITAMLDTWEVSE